jgi:Carboxypeptidase regulatory-like domain/TonB dependent receptor-like, beta-barrel/TonB-dependent Receptor Plug Domain
MRRSSSLIALFIVLVLGSYSVAEAQQGVGSIRGRVTDEQKAVLPGVAIIVTHAESGTIRETTSGDDGTYLVQGLIPGPYKISAQLSGFSRLTQEDLLLRVGVTLTVDLALKVGAVEENITVTAESPQVDLTTAQVGGSVNSGDLTNLPSGSRNFTSLVALLPGVVYNAAADSSSDSVTINGQASTGVVYLMDGASNNDDLRGGSSGAQARPPMEGIQEFQVVTNQFDAEYGAATAGVVNAVSKQGTNVMHGSGFGYYTNNSMTAKDFFVEQQGLDKPETTKKQWGATLGGPIMQDKMHYFVSFERQDRDEGRSRVYPTRPDKSFTVAQQTNSYNYMGRMDHQLNSNHNYNVRFLWDHQPNYDQVLGGTGSPPTQGTLETLSIEKDNDWSLVTQYNWVAGGARLNTLRAQAVHEKPKRGQPLYQESGDWTLAAPTIQHINFIDVADVNYADYRDMNTYGVDDTFSWFVNGSRGGTHDLKFGTQYQLQEHYREDQRFMNGAFQLNTDQDFNAAIPSTYPERLTIRVPQMVQLLSLTHSVGVFAQDKWQINQHLTLSAGLRYDIHITPLLETWNPLFTSESAYPIDKNNWQPRVGFAYAMGPAAVLRGGYGLFYEKQYVDRYENYSLNRVFTNSFSAQYPVSGPDPGPSSGRLPTDPLLVNGPVLNRTLINQIVPPGTLARNTATVWLDNPDRILPWQHQASIGYERQIGRQLAVAADYMHIVNKDMPLRYNLNPGIKQTTSRTEVAKRTDLLGIANQLGISPFGADVYTTEYIGETKYDGLNLAIEKRYADNWSARFSYALGKGEGNTNGTPTASNDFQVLGERNLDQNFGPTSADRRHAVTISGRTEVRKIPGLTAGAVVRMATGTSFTIHNSNIDANKNNVLVDPLPAGTYSGTGQNAMTFENAGGRNGAYGPGTLQVDLRAGYKMRMAQVRTIDFFFEVFNLTNEPNFANPSGDVRSGATFLVPTSLAGGGFPRQFQIGARYGF